MKFIYPAIFEREDEAYNVSFPDIPGCFTFGIGILDAYEMAKEAMEIMICDYFAPEHKKTVPVPSAPETIVCPDNSFVSLVYSDFDPIQLEQESKVTGLETVDNEDFEESELPDGTTKAILEYCGLSSEDKEDA